VDWTSPKHIKPLRKWFFNVFRFIGIGAVVWDIQILGFRAAFFDRFGSLTTDKEEDELAQQFLHGRVKAGGIN